MNTVRLGPPSFRELIPPSFVSSLFEALQFTGVLVDTRIYKHPHPFYGSLYPSLSIPAIIYEPRRKVHAAPPLPCCRCRSSCTSICWSSESSFFNLSQSHRARRAPLDPVPEIHTTSSPRQDVNRAYWLAVHSPTHPDDTTHHTPSSTLSQTRH